MDRCWTEEERTTPEYVKWVKDFVIFAFAHKKLNRGKLRCPCRKCNNVLYQDSATMEDHMICYGFDNRYMRWYYEWESSLPSSSSIENVLDDNIDVNVERAEVTNLVQDAFGHSEVGRMDGIKTEVGGPQGEDFKKFSKFVRDSEKITRSKVFLATHKRKNGDPVNEWVGEKIRQVEELLSQPEIASQDKTGRDDIYSQVMGTDERRGQVCGYGLGPTPSTLWGSSTRAAVTSDSILQDEVRSLRDELVARDTEIASMKESMAIKEIEMITLKESMATKDIEMTSLKETMAMLTQRLDQVEKNVRFHGGFANKGKQRT